MAGIKYIAPLLDGSGYSQAARNYALSIHKQGYPITLAPISFERARPDLGSEGEVLKSLINKPIEYDKVIVHTTPDLWRQLTHYETSKYKIGCTVWETSAIHPSWVSACNSVDEVFLPCDWNMQVFKDSGVERPLFKIPHAVEIPDLTNIPSYSLEGISDTDFVFYSIFQWQERKNPYALLAAYCAAFSGVEDVVLVLKTYKTDQANDLENVRSMISEFKKYINLPSYPKMYLIVKNLSNEDITALHKKGDCFVLLQKSEGWGLPHCEAAACGNPVITPRYGGQVEFLNDENSYLIDYSLTPVMGMGWSPYYLGTQFWCEPDIKHAMQLMRQVYNNRKEAKDRGSLAREQISRKFSFDAIGKALVEKLSEIDGRI